MANLILYLRVDALGIQASIPGRPGPATERAEVLWKDLPESDSEKTEFARAMDLLAETVDLGECRGSVVLLPDDQFCFRTLVLPFSARGKVLKILEHELIPCLPRDDIPYSIGFKVSGSCFIPDENLVFTASLPADRIQDLTHCLLSHKLPPAVIAPEDHGALAGHFIGESGNYAYVSIRSNRISLIVTAGKDPVFARTFLCQEPGWDGLVLQIRAALTGFCLRFGAQGEFEIILISLDSPQAGDALEKAFQKELSGVPKTTVTQVNPVDPTAFLKPGSLPGGLVNLADGFGGAAAFVRENKVGIWTTGGMVAVVIFLFMAGIWRDTAELEVLIHDRQRAAQAVFLQGFPDKADIMGPSPLLVMQSLVAREEKKVPGDGLAGLSMPGVTPILAELSARIPQGQDTVITRLNMNNGRIALAGKTNNFNQVDRIKTGLGASPLFKTVTITNAQADKTGGDIRFKFALTL